MCKLEPGAISRNTNSPTPFTLSFLVYVTRRKAKAVLARPLIPGLCSQLFLLTIDLLNCIIAHVDPILMYTSQP